MALFDERIVRRVFRHCGDLAGAGGKVDSPVGIADHVDPHAAVAHAIDRVSFPRVTAVKATIVEVRARGCAAATAYDNDTRSKTQVPRRRRSKFIS